MGSTVYKAPFLHSHISHSWGKKRFFSPSQILVALADLVNSLLAQRTCKRVLIHNKVPHFVKKITSCLLWGWVCTILAQILSVVSQNSHSSLFHSSYSIKSLWKVTVMEGSNFASSSNHPQLDQLILDKGIWTNNVFKDKHAAKLVWSSFCPV